MRNNKPDIGFTTPAKEIQEALAKVQKELAKNRTDWESMNKIFVPMQTEFGQHLDKSIKSTEGISSADFTVLMQLISLCALSKLGAEVTEIHQRLAKVERRIQDSKLTKG